MLKIKALRTEYLENPIGIDAQNPRLSWKLESDRQGVMQKSYQVTAALDSAFETIVWDSGMVQSDASVQVLYKGEKLCSGQRVYWKVKVTAEGETTEIEAAESETVFFEMGLLKEEDWKGKWIEAVREPEDIEKLQSGVLSTPGVPGKKGTCACPNLSDGTWTV